MIFFFLERLTGFQQISLSEMFEKFWICLWHRSLKYCDFKTSNLPEKWKKRLYILYILNKRTITTENRSTVLHNLFLLNMLIFNELVIKNDFVEKAKSSMVPEEKTFYWKVLSKLYRNSKFNILANFNLVLPTS